MREVYTIVLRYKHSGENHCCTTILVGNRGATEVDIKYAVMDQVLPLGSVITSMDSVIMSDRTLLNIVEVAKEKNLV
jgi:hypothetical protein